MNIGIPNEQQPNEYRVGLSPQGVRLVVEGGHRCYIQQHAGEGAGFQDAEYEQAGGCIIYDAKEAYERSDLILKVGPLTLSELELPREGQTICAFWHLAAQPREVIQALLATRITTVAYETIQQDDGQLPVLYPLSEIAGRMASQIAARWLQNDGGGSGILLGGVAGIPPVEVGIIGAGVVGTNAARAFLRQGAQVTLLDKSLSRLREVEARCEHHVVTMVAYDFNISRVMKYAHVLVGAVLVPGERAPVVVTREMVRMMRPRSVIVDISIDQGGCVETSRPMTHANPVFVEENVIHYCVPNMPGVVARTATQAYLNAAWPYISKLCKMGTQPALDDDPALRRGVAIHDGKIVSDSLITLLRGL